MKKITLFLFLLTASFGFSQTFPIDFTDPLDDTFVPFNGAVTALTTDPTDALNDVLQLDGCDCNWDGASIDFGQPLNLSEESNNTVTFRINPLNGTGSGSHLLKFENGTTPVTTELPFTTTGTGWQTISVDFGADLGSYGRMSIFTDAGNTDLDSYLFDDFDGPPHDVVCAGSTGATPGTDFTLVWADEFSVDGAPCPDNWGYDLGAGGWGNGEAQTYTSNPDNVIVEGGLLKIIAKDDGAGGYTSARLKTQDKYEFTYGKVEIRAKLPIEDGTWSALWMLGADFPNTPWPAVGEIDIMEHTGNNENEVLGTVHNTAGSGGSAFGGSIAMPTPTDFHNYSIIWDENEITFYVDDVLFFTYNPSPQNADNYPYTSDFFLIMNVAMGGTLGGAIDPAFTSGSMEIDYVRVYQQAGAVTEPTTDAPIPPARCEADVISIYSDAYTNIDGINYNPDWGQSGFPFTDPNFDPTGAGTNFALAYLNFNYQGTDFAGNPQDASAMEFLHVDIWTADATDVQVTPINIDGTGATEFLVNVPVVSGSWNSVDLPMSAFTGMTWDSVKQMKFDGQAGVTPSNIYLDNIYFYKAASSAPTTDAPTPPARDPNEVISIYSDAYANISGVDYNPDWGQSGFPFTDSTYDPTGGGTNFVLAYENFNYQGTDFAGNPQNASTMSYLHVDIWTSNATDVKVTPINLDGTGATEFLVNVPLVCGDWSSVDIPMSAFTGMTWDSIKQLKFDGQAGVTPSDIYVDNIYFYIDTTPQTEPTADAPTPPERCDADVISIYSDAYTNIDGINYNPDWGQSGFPFTDPNFDPTGAGTNFALAYLNFNYQGTDFAGNPQDASAMEFLHVDIWTADATDVQVTPINIDGTGATEFLVNVPVVSGSWNSVDLPMSAFTGMTWDSVKQMKFDGQAGVTPSNIYLDNIYFYKAASSAPTTDAPTPPARDPNEVISIYSDAYANISGVDYNPDWGQSGFPFTDSTYDPTGGGTNFVLAYENFNYQGTDFAGNPQNASTMSYLHVDIWTSNATDVKVTPINLDGTGATEFLVNVPLVCGAWSSVDIPMADFTGMTWDSVKQLKFDGQAGVTPSDIYVDNIYFFKGEPLGINDEIISGLKVFPNPSRSSWNVRTNNVTLNSIQVFNVLGKQVLSFRPHTVDATIDATSLANGLYFARITAEEGTETIKLIKQ